MLNKPFESNRKLVLLAGIAMALGLTACGGGGGSSSTTSSSSNVLSSSGSLSLSITDSPVDSALAVVVTFTGVILNPEDGDRIEIDYDTPKQIDLLALNGGETELLLDDESVPAGHYSWIRLKVDESASYIDVGSGDEPLSIPSGAQTGLKLNRGFTVQEDGSAAFTIDFDLRKSVTQAAGNYKLRPTLRMMDDSTVGALSGVVDSTVISAKCADASLSAGAVYVFEDETGSADDYDGDSGDPIASAMVDLTDYSYTVAFLPEGDYLAAYTCDAVDDEADDPSDGDSEDDTLDFVGETVVTITAGKTTTKDF